MKLTEFFGKQDRRTLIASGIFLLAAVAAADMAIGPEFESSICYLLPVSFFAWFVNRQSGMTTAGIAALATVSIHRFVAVPRYSNPGVLYWNGLAWLGVYTFFVVVIAELRELYERERRLSRTDALTGIYNRRAFMEALDLEKDRARRYHHPLTLAYLDLDDFKAINDRFGHTAGDRVLAATARIMQANVRRVDMVARLGGDEFGILLPESGSEAAAVVLDKVHALLDAAMLGDPRPVSFSMGAVTFQPPPDSIDEMMAEADQMMYAAKRSGSKRVTSRRPAA